MIKIISFHFSPHSHSLLMSNHRSYQLIYAWRPVSSIIKCYILGDKTIAD